MNQDHLQQQPAADAYVTGGPSEFAEDVHDSTGTWKAEYEAGQTARNEIGMPEMRADTFKVAGLDEETLHKKAEVCIRVARQMLPGAKAASVEDQALALMHLPDVELIQTANRLAKKLSEDDKEAEDDKEGQDEGQQAKPQQQAKQGQDQGQEQGQDQGQEQEQPAKEQQKKQAQDLAAAIQSGDLGQIQSAIEQMVQQAQQQAPAPQQGGQQAQQQVQQAQQPQVQQAQQQPVQGCGVTAEQVQQMVQQALQQMSQGQQQPVQGQGQQQPPVQGQGQPQMSDDQLLDQMLMDQGQAPMPDMDVQLEGAPMDIGEVGLGPGDEVLSQLFASHQEVRQAAQAKAIEDGVAPQTTSPIRTASTRTVGTRPTGGVSQIGGATASTGGNDVDKLSGLWRSAPDVSKIFGSEG